jgi:2-methylcitrate dehydratase PrpD
VSGVEHGASASAAERLISAVQASTAGPIPDHIVRKARTLLLDTLGVGVAGAVTEESRNARVVVEAWGGVPQASVWGGGPLLPTGSSAFINAHQIHTLEWDPIHEPAVVHAMTVVTPVVLAWAQRESMLGRTVTGMDLLKGIIAGVDVAGGLGVATTTPLRFFRPATAGALGAVVGTGIAAGWDIERIMSALGIAYGGLSGTMQPHTEGAQVLALQVGFNARAAMNAIDFASAGFHGPRFILEGRYGYYTLIEADGDPERLITERGTIWEVERTSLKPFPSGRATHGALDGLLQLQRKHGFRKEDVESVDIHVPPMVFGLVGRRPTTDMPIGAARLCLAYLVPCLLEDGTVDVDTYRAERIQDPDLIAWTERVTIKADDNPDPNAFNPQSITVRLIDGSEHRITLDYSLGSPEHPLTTEQAKAKFDSAMTIGGRAEFAEPLYHLMESIEERRDLNELWTLL